MSVAKQSTVRGGPDEGWAWVVALSCFFINFIMAGLARTAGVLYVALIDLYGVSREAATTPFSVRVCVRNLTGPVIGLLGQRYGIRPITTIGALFAAVGGILCFLAPDVFWITIFWGGIHGLGFGLSTILHMMAIHQYFEKYKASAFGLAYSGDCFGTFAFPVLLEFLISNYGVRGTFLILGGIVLNVVPAALLLKPPPWLREPKQKTIPPKDKNSKMLRGQAAVIREEDIPLEIIPRHSLDDNPATEQPDSSPPNYSCLKDHDTKSSSMTENTSMHSTVGITSLPHTDFTENGCYTNQTLYETMRQEEINNALNRTYSEKAKTREEKYREVMSSQALSEQISKGGKKVNLLLTIKKVITNPMFNIISLTMAVYAFLFVAVITIIIDFGIDKGVSQQEGKYLVIGFSVADLVGRLSFGGFIDKKVISMRHYVMFTVIAMGGLVVCIPWASDFPQLMVIMALYGLMQGGVAIMFPILLGIYMSRQEENIAMGCMNFYGGIIMLGLAPMIGYFRDNIGTYDGAFYVVGGVTVFMGLLWLLEPIITKKQRKSLDQPSNLGPTQEDVKVMEKV